MGLLFRRFLAVLAASCATAAFGQNNVLTYQQDNFRDGWNSNETILTKGAVSETTFGLLYSLPVDGMVFAQPLSVAGVTIDGQVHNVVYVCTEHNSVYAFDANSSTGANSAYLWHVNLGTPVPFVDVVGNIPQQVGITGTPVIRLSSPGVGCLYVVAMTKETDSSGNVAYRQRLHALDIRTGAEALGGPVEIRATVNGVGDGTDGKGHVPFNPQIQSQRPGLLYFNNGTTQEIVIAWASFGDNGPYHGWIMAYDANTLQQLAVFNTTANAMTAGPPNYYPLAAGGIWQAGCALASDGTSIYCATGNGTFDPSIGAYGDSVLKLNPNLTLADYFTPNNQLALDEADEDLGSGGVVLMPPGNGATTTAMPNLMVTAGKEGTLRILDRDNLGQYNTSKDESVVELPGVMHGIWGSPAYFNGTIYYGPVGSPLVAFTVVNDSILGDGYRKSTTNSFGYPGTTPTMSSSGAHEPILWAVDATNYNTGKPAQLYAYDGFNVGRTIYSSAASGGRDVMGVPIEFAIPLVEGGRVFVGCAYQLDVFGLGKWAATPVIQTASGNYQNSVTVNVTDATAGAQLYYTTDGSVPTQSSTLLSGGSVTLTTNATFTVRAFASGMSQSGTATANYQISPVYGSGTGLTGAYFNNENLTAPATVTEVDPTINFNWNDMQPVPGVGPNMWSAEWTGSLQALCTTSYTLYTQSDDGVRVWLNGKEIINDWSLHAPRWDLAGPLHLVAGTKYTIKIDYFQGTAADVLKMYWSSPGLPMEGVPKSQLYP